ncbi:hypothetical protein DAKH74_019760 [Maudiozyma humilis]|uniref:CBM21 domain-containing protein n=1 Tax=Maudiozyma humilis TaxID=51915 RepID=A0AAV5RUZ9_MAUHU|nr:hypothetical protein DAKH74_019760 [Kazachstania humilis]
MSYSDMPLSSGTVTERNNKALMDNDYDMDIDIDSDTTVERLPPKLRLQSKTTDSIRTPLAPAMDGVDRRQATMKRSMSMPFMIKSILSKPSATFNNRRGRNGSGKHHMRSKSVHFDERLPIKVYQLDDTPRVISDDVHAQRSTGAVNFDTQKPLGRMTQEYYEHEDDEPLQCELSDDSTTTPPHEANGFYDFNFPVFNYAQGLESLRVNYFFNHAKQDVYLRDLLLEYDRGAREWRLAGTVAVRNIHFEKFVVVRYTTSAWRDSADVAASYAGHCPEAAQFDLFRFAIGRLADRVNYDYGSRSVGLEFCINYQTTEHREQSPGLEFWDNNNDKNYRMRLVVGTERDEQQDEEADIKDIARQFRNWGLRTEQQAPGKSRPRRTSTRRKQAARGKQSIAALLGGNDSDSDLDADLEIGGGSGLDASLFSRNSGMRNNFGWGSHLAT